MGDTVLSHAKQVRKVLKRACDLHGHTLNGFKAFEPIKNDCYGFHSCILHSLRFFGFARINSPQRHALFADNITRRCFKQVTHLFLLGVPLRQV